MFALMCKAAIIAITSGLIICFFTIIIPDIIYGNVRNKKLKKILDHDLVRAYFVLFMMIICSALIIGFIYLIE